MKYYSASQINQFLRCPQQWAYRYMEGIKIPPASALLQGISYHKALETNFTQKIESHCDLPVTQVTEAYASCFDETMKNGIEWNKEEVSAGVNNVAGQMKDEGVRLVETYQVGSDIQAPIAPRIQPKEVEKQFDLEFENVDYKLTGRIDLIDSEDIIHDHKTAEKSPSKDVNQKYKPADRDILQASVYALATLRGAFSFDYAIKKKKPEIIQVKFEITKEDAHFTLSLLSKIDASAKTGVFIPNRTSFMCSRKSCGYWGKCESDNGGRVKD